MESIQEVELEGRETAHVHKNQLPTDFLGSRNLNHNTVFLQFSKNVHFKEDIEYESVTHSNTACNVCGYREMKHFPLHLIGRVGR